MKQIRLSLNGSSVELREFLRHTADNKEIAFALINIPYIPTVEMPWLLLCEDTLDWQFTTEMMPHFNITKNYIEYKGEIIADYTQLDDITDVPDWGEADMIIDFNNTIRSKDQLQLIHKKPSQRVLFTHYIEGVPVVVHNVYQTPIAHIPEFACVPDMQALTAVYALMTASTCMRNQNYRYMHYIGLVPPRSDATYSDAEHAKDYVSARSGMLNITRMRNSNTQALLKVVFPTKDFFVSEYVVPARRTMTFAATVWGDAKFGAKMYVEASKRDFEWDQHPCHGLLEYAPDDSLCTYMTKTGFIYNYYYHDFEEGPEFYITGSADVLSAYCEHLKNVVLNAKDRPLEKTPE